MALAVSPIWKQECFKEVKTVKTGTKFIVRDTAQSMGEHAEKKFIFLSQKLGRNTHWESSAAILNEEHSKEVI